MQQFVYHMVPKKFFGNTLYPLNQLKEKKPEIYHHQRAKYEDHPYRKTLPFRTIPKLNCLWNDVLHFSPVNPKIIYREWTRLGDEIQPDTKWFAIPIQSLPQKETAVFHCRPENWSIERDHELEEEYSLVDIEKYREETQLRRATIDWYKDWISQGRRGAYFMYIPHILAKAPVSTANVAKFCWSDPL